MAKCKEPSDVFPVSHETSIRTYGGSFSDPDPGSGLESQSSSTPDPPTGLLSTQDHIRLLETECEVVCPTRVGPTLKLLKETLAHCSKTVSLVEHQEPITRSEPVICSSLEALSLVLLLYEKSVSTYDQTVNVLETMYHSQWRTKHLPGVFLQEETEQHRTVIRPGLREQYLYDSSGDFLHPAALSIKLGTYDLDILEQACLYGGLVTLQLGSSKVFLEDLKSAFSTYSLAFPSCSSYAVDDPQWTSINRRLQDVEEHLNRLRAICAWYGVNH